MALSFKILLVLCYRIHVTIVQSDGEREYLSLPYSNRTITQTPSTRPPSGIAPLPCTRCLFVSHDMLIAVAITHPRQEDRTSRESVAVILPQLCRLSHQLTVREAQGSGPPASVWEVLLRCADCGVSGGKGRDDNQGLPCVQVCVYLFICAKTDW